MTIWTTSSDAANTVAQTVRKTRMTTIGFKARGLKPQSKYTLWCNNVDVSWACKTKGSRMGEILLSDAGGMIDIEFMAEIEVNSNGSTQPRLTSLVLKDLGGVERASGLITQTIVSK